MEASSLRRRVVLLVVVAVVAAQAVGVCAETEEPEPALVYESAGEPAESTPAAEGPPAVELQLGGYLPAFSTNLRVDARVQGETVGTGIDFEEALGLDEDARIWRLDGRWRVGRKSRIGFAYYRFDRSAEAIVEEDIEWGDETFPAGAGVAANFRTRMLILNYQQTLIESEQWDVAGSLGLHYFNFTTTLETVGPGAIDLEASASAPAPLPMIGVDALYRASPQWRFGAKAEGLAISIGDYSGRWVDLGLTAEYFPAPHWAIGLGLNNLSIDLSADSENLLGELEYEQVGLRWFVTGWF
jgi:hypothetical protein